VAIRATAWFRCLTAKQLAEIVSGSAAHFGRRLRLLFDHGYLDRPKAQVTNIIAVRSQPTVYALGKAGAELLTELDGIPLDHLDWQLKNSRAGSMFIAHTIEVAGAMIQVLSAATRENWQLLDHFDLLPAFPDNAMRRRNPFSLAVTINDEFKQPQEFAVVPDRLFSLQQDNKRLNFALEVDRGTMPVHRASFESGTSLSRKLRLYWLAWERRAHQAAWGFRQFRVLVITPSDERIASIRRMAMQHIPNPTTSFFLFTTPQRIDAHGPLAPIWNTITGEVPISPLASVPQAQLFTS
jgi:hypothetical protein